jgi:hypothetical protein
MKADLAEVSLHTTYHWQAQVAAIAGHVRAPHGSSDACAACPELAPLWSGNMRRVRPAGSFYFRRPARSSRRIVARSRWRAPPEQVQAVDLTNWKRSHAKLALGLKFHEDHRYLTDGNGRRWGSRSVGEASRKRPCDEPVGEAARKRPCDDDDEA